jgi:RHS repeat-associated protein
MELDNEVSGNGNSYTTEFRQYDPRLGRWKSLDPLMAQFPLMSPFVAFDNNPVFYVDPLGLSSEGGPGDGQKNSKTDKGDKYNPWKDYKGKPPKRYGLLKRLANVLTLHGNRNEVNRLAVKHKTSEANVFLHPEKDVAVVITKTDGKELVNYEYKRSLYLVGDEDSPLMARTREAHVWDFTYGGDGEMEFDWDNVEIRDLMIGGTPPDIGFGTGKFKLGWKLLKAAKNPKAFMRMVRKNMSIYKSTAKEGVKAYSKATFNAFEKQLAKDGMKSILKTQSNIQRKLTEHIIKLSEIKKAGGYSSSVEREIRTFQSQLHAIDDLLK